MTIEILIFCHAFQRRLCWVLSSLLQQESHGLEIIVNISGLEEDNGTPSNREVAAFFREKDLDVRLTEYETKEQIARPSLLKNKQIQNSDAEWLMCHSADHCFHPTYFRVLEDTIAMWPDDDRVLGSGNKHHTSAPETDKLMARTIESEPRLVANAFMHADKLPHFTGKAGRSMGGHFCVRRQAIMEKTGGVYVEPERCSDRHLFNQGMRTKSDPVFRRRMGKNQVKFAPLIHLNHSARDKELGHHSNEQR